MPVYTYACTACGHEIERRQSFSDAPLTTCESCGGTLRRVLHPVGVIFKGSGFYNTDYKKSGNGSSTAEAAEKKDSSDAKKDGADTKTADSSSAPSAPASKSETAASPAPSSTATRD